MPERNVGYVRLAAVLSSTMEMIFTGSPVAFPLGAAVVAALVAAVVSALGAAVVCALGAAVVCGVVVVFELPQLASATINAPVTNSRVPLLRFTCARRISVPLVACMPSDGGLRAPKRWPVSYSMKRSLRCQQSPR
jgi:hypothetical protein